MIGLMVVGLVARLYFFSGYGLADDPRFRSSIAYIVDERTLSGNNIGYRFAWWLPTVLASWIWDLNEMTLILPTTLMSTLGIGLLYMFGKALWGQPGALIAATLLIVHPLDFAWSTMLANDIFVSFFSALSILLILLALQMRGPRSAPWLWIGAGVALWLSCHTKLTAVLVMPAIAVICWSHRKQLTGSFLWFIATAVVLFGASGIFLYIYFGDPFAPYEFELRSAGLLDPELVLQHRVTWSEFWSYPRSLFLPNHLGNRIHSIYPHLLVLCALLGPFLGLSTSGAVCWWFFFVFVGMQFNLRLYDDTLVGPFRNVRFGHVFVYPIILMLTGYLVGLRLKYPKVVVGLLVPLLITVGGWQSVSTASKTKATFGDCRNALHLLRSLPPGRFYSDFQIGFWWTVLDVKDPAWRFQKLHDMTKERTEEIAAIESGYLITGGGRVPYYGCPGCIPLANELDPEQWRLLAEFPMPKRPTFWRPEPIRLWEARGGRRSEPRKR